MADLLISFINWYPNNVFLGPNKDLRLKDPENLKDKQNSELSHEIDNEIMQAQP
jgi:hypothetical protein